MRLIDANALSEELQMHGYALDDYEEDSTDEAWAKGFNAGIDHAIHHLIYAPTIDAEPMVHSHWEVAIGYDPKKKVACQNCFMMAHEPTKRCPHCGAHMDEEVDNGEID